MPPWPKPQHCRARTFYPISFGVPKEDIVECLPEKFEGFASLVPGRWETYVFPTTSWGELEYKRMYREARFALCPKKAGWETMRIYEILASGSVPFVPELMQMPKGTLPFLRRGLLLKAMSLPGIDADRGSIDISTFDDAAYAQLASELLLHTQKRLSTEAIAAYMLAAMGKPNAKHVLFVANCGHGDYQCYLSLHGMRAMLGAGLTDVPKLPYMYRQRPKAMDEISRETPCPQSLCAVVSGNSRQPVLRNFGAMVPVYGGGFSYAFRLEEQPTVNRSRHSVLERIRNRQFDLVVFGNADVHGAVGGRSAEQIIILWEAVFRHYSTEEIAIIDGRDPPKLGGFHEDVLELASKARLFLREIPSECG